MKSGLVLEGMTPPWEQLRPRLAGSKFRSRFKLADADRAYVARTGWETLRSQAEKIVREDALRRHAAAASPYLEYCRGT